jgi:phosphoserine phosphatase RsbU/P
MFSAEATYQLGTSPLMTRLNQGVCRRGIEGRFLTAFYGMLAPGGAFTYTNAGHNAPVLVSTSSAVRRLETGGMVLGLFEHAGFEQETVMLSPGDFIVAFSDGVTEALNEAGEEYMDDRLLACIDAHKTKPPQDILAAILADVRTFAGEATPNDDVTVVMVRYGG